MKEFIKGSVAAVGFIATLVVFLILITSKVQAQERTMDGTVTWDAPTQRTDGTPLATNEIAGYTVSYKFMCDGCDWTDGDFVVGTRYEFGSFTLPEAATGMEWRIRTFDTVGRTDGWVVIEKPYIYGPNPPTNLEVTPNVVVNISVVINTP